MNGGTQRSKRGSPDPNENWLMATGYDHPADPPKGITPNRAAYLARCRAVYDLGEPHCVESGPNNARCVLPPGHAGDDHEGNGFDAWGPLYRQWTTERRVGALDAQRAVTDAESA